MSISTSSESDDEMPVEITNKTGREIFNKELESSLVVKEARKRTVASINSRNQKQKQEKTQPAKVDGEATQTMETVEFKDIVVPNDEQVTTEPAQLTATPITMALKPKRLKKPKFKKAQENHLDRLKRNRAPVKKPFASQKSRST